VNSLFVLLGIESWKPFISALLLPPVPLLLATLVGARMILWRRGWGWLVVGLSIVALWLSSCTGMGEWLQRSTLKPPPALVADRIAELKQQARAGHTAIVVLGGGRETLAPEYGMSNLQSRSLERLRYGIWLSRELNAPLAFSGGSGHGQAMGTSEAEIAARIAQQEFGRPLKWNETESRDTRENASRSLAVLKPAGVRQIVLVTNGFHMSRSVRAFEEAIAQTGGEIEVVAAPMGLAQHDERPALRWLPGSDGFVLVRQVLHEAVGLMLGA
jgi:uncharacterized SAM-binding protein YcdF (DUF218 family)